VLVNNVRWSVPGFIAEDNDRAEWQRVVEINFYIAFACTLRTPYSALRFLSSTAQKLDGARRATKMIMQSFPREQQTSLS
jgi:hypothetical protein